MHTYHNIFWHDGDGAPFRLAGPRATAAATPALVTH